MAGAALRLLPSTSPRHLPVVPRGPFKWPLTGAFDRRPSVMLLLLCTCYLPRCKCLAKLWLDVLCLLGAPPIVKPSFTPSPNLKVQIFKFTYYNDRSLEPTHWKLDKYTILHLILSQLGWTTLSPTIIMATIQGTIHTTTTKHLQDLHIPNSKIHKLMKSFSQIAIKYLSYVILNEGN